MYLPKNSYRIKTTYGGEFQKPSGKDYVGKYIETNMGKTLAGDSLENAKGILLSTEEQNLLEIQHPYNDYFGPTDNDYKRGEYIRYFTQDKRSSKIVEMSEKQWRQKKRLKYLSPGRLIWILKGPAGDREVNGVPYKGASTKNRETLLNLEKDFPGITEFFKSTSEFVR